jgi:heme/copper-type cytochrome/quinol oxidase subunit 1
MDENPTTQEFANISCLAALVPGRMKSQKPIRRDWKAAFLILSGGAILYVVSLMVALASDDSTWDKYIPLFRVGQDIGFLVFVVGVLSIAVVALTKCIGLLVKRLNQ